MGVDKENQDRSGEVLTFAKSKGCSLFLVADGHGQNGGEVSEFIRNKFPVNLEMEFINRKEASLDEKPKCTNSSRRISKDDQGSSSQLISDVLSSSALKSCFVNAY